MSVATPNCTPYPNSRDPVWQSSRPSARTRLVTTAYISGVSGTESSLCLRAGDGSAERGATSSSGSVARGVGAASDVALA